MLTNQRLYQRRVMIVLGLSACSLTAAACNAKAKVTTLQGPSVGAAAAAQPTLIPNGATLKGSRTNYQTRDVIAIDVENSLLAGAPTFSVLNITQSPSNDATALVLIGSAAPVPGLADNGSYNLSDSSTPGQTEIDFYLEGSDISHKFFYGSNTLKVISGDPSDQRFALVNLTLMDFTISDMAAMAFVDNSQTATSNDGSVIYQGWMNVLGPPTVAVDTGYETVGMFDIINGQ